MTQQQAEDDHSPSPAELFTRAVALLTAQGDLRVWSVIISVFGDLALERNDVITGTLLTRLTTLMGLKPEAVRVALFRLRKDGWITSHKTGRSSAYRLTDMGFRETQAARTRIYAPSLPEPESWQLLVSRPMVQAARAQDEKTLQEQGFHIIGPGIYLGAGNLAAGDGFLAVDGQITRLPDWLRAAVPPDGLEQGFAELCARLGDLSALLDGDIPALDATERATLRVLIVHHWRRLLLRQPNLPDRFFPDGWPGVACRGRVMALLARLERPALDELQETPG